MGNKPAPSGGPLQVRLWLADDLIAEAVASDLVEATGPLAKLRAAYGSLRASIDPPDQ